MSLALLVVLQPSVLCACAVEHAFFCGAGHEPGHSEALDPGQAATSGDVHGGAASADCRGHHARAACGSRESLSVSCRVPAGLGVPALPAFAEHCLFNPSALAPGCGFLSTSPESPPGSDRRVPLLN